MSARGDLLRFSVPGGTEKIAGLWFAKGGSLPRLTLCYYFDRCLLELVYRFLISM